MGKAVMVKQIKIFWRDSKSFTGWRSDEDMYDETPADCETLGFVIKEKKDIVIVAQTLDRYNVSSLNHIIIPKETIKKMVTVKEISE